jgi:thiol-disulfide isomerase/thioredoxin
MKLVTTIRAVPTLIAAALVAVVALVSLAATPHALADKPSSATVIAVVNRADWCPACKQHGPSAMKTFEAANRNAFALVVNDLTDDATKQKSQTALSQAGVADAMAKLTATAVIYFFDAKSKKKLVEHKLSSGDLEAAMKKALAAATK